MKKVTRFISIILALMLAIGLIQNSFVLAFAEEAEKQITGIEIVQLPNITEFNEGIYEEDLDFSGLKISVIYSDNTNSVYSYVKGEYYYHFENDDSDWINPEMNLIDGVYLKYGENKIEVCYEGCYAYFDVTGLPLKAESIKITNMPGQTVFEVGEPYDFRGLSFDITYDDGSTDHFDGYEDDTTFYKGYDITYKYNDNNRLVMGENTITVSYRGASDSFKIKVVESTRKKSNFIKDIKITKLPDKVTYVRHFESLYLSGIEITVIFKDNSTKKIIYKYYGFDYESDTFNENEYVDVYDKQGNQYMGKGNITVEFCGFTDEFEVDWIESPVEKIEVTKKPDRVFTAEETAYEVTKNMDGAEIAVTYKDGTTNTYTFGEMIRALSIKSPTYDINGFQANVEEGRDYEHYEVTVNYLGAECTFRAKNYNDGDIPNPILSSLSDALTGIKVRGTFTSDTILNVEEVNVGLSWIKAAYNINLIKGGVNIQPEGEITVYIPYNSKDLRVFRIMEDGSAENVKAEYENGKFIYKVTRLSTVAIVSGEITGYYGDVDDDGMITVKDATIVQKLGAGIETQKNITGFLHKFADVDADGRISIIDATNIQKYLVGGYRNVGKTGEWFVI